MARTSITYTEVKNTCLTLESRGEKVTVRSIRASLGSGSDSTIAEHLRQYRDEQSKMTEESVLNQLSQNLRANFIKFIQAASNDLKSIENTSIKQMSDELKELREIISKLESEKNHLVQENAQLQKNYQYQLNITSKLKDDLTKVELDLNDTRERETKARIECAVLQSKLTDRDSKIAELQYLLQKK